MRKSLAPVLVVALVLALAASAWLFVRFRQESARFEEMQSSERASRESYSRTLDAIAEIQDSLDAIAPRDSLLGLKPGSLVTEEQLAGPNAQRALERIASLRSSIARSRDRIRQLESDLGRAGVRAEGMRKVIEKLRRDLGEKQSALDEMVARVTTLEGRVTGLEAEVQQGRDTLLARDAALEDRRRELATVFYVVGTRRALRQQGAIVMKGGFLGLGGTPVPAGRIPETVLAPLDTDVSDVIPTGAAKARLLTAQPAGSWELRSVDGVMELHILDRTEFRKVRQVIILTG